MGASAQRGAAIAQKLGTGEIGADRQVGALFQGVEDLLMGGAPAGQARTGYATKAVAAVADEGFELVTVFLLQGKSGGLIVTAELLFDGWGGCDSRVANRT